jgi:hypothetical protein
MIKAKQRWKRLGEKITKGGHSLFLEISTGRIAIADNSGNTPDKTEDGVLYIDNRKSVFAITCGKRVSYVIPLLTSDNRSTTIITDLRGAIRVCQECNNKLSIHKDLRELFVDIIKGRIVLSE